MTDLSKAAIDNLERRAHEATSDTAFAVITADEGRTILALGQQRERWFATCEKCAHQRGCACGCNECLQGWLVEERAENAALRAERERQAVVEENETSPSSWRSPRWLRRMRASLRKWSPRTCYC